MLDDLEIVFKKVLDLAEKRRLVETEDEVNLEEFELEDLEECEEERNLRIYIESLDYETIKTLQVIMYLGRDMDYDREDTPDLILHKQRKHFDSLGWNKDKDIEVNQMVEKIPLGEYLRNGLEILNINI